MAESFSTGLRNALLGTSDFKTLMNDGVLAIYSGTKPASADAAEGAGSLLMLYTLDAGAFVAGEAANGLSFDTVANGVISKTALENWSGVGLEAAGTGTTATWFRFYDNDYVTGASTSAIRFDGSIGTSSSYELRMSNTTIVEDGPATVSTFTVTFPAA
jgi:hypothetical protein